MELDSAIWSQAHDDTIYNMIEQSDRPTQIRWAGTSRIFHNFCVPRIWHTLLLYGRDFDQYAGHVHDSNGYITENTDGQNPPMPGILRFLFEKP